MDGALIGTTVVPEIIKQNRPGAMVPERMAANLSPAALSTLVRNHGGNHREIRKSSYQFRQFLRWSEIPNQGCGSYSPLKIQIQQFVHFQLALSSNQRPHSDFVRMQHLDKCNKRRYFLHLW